MKKLQKLNHHQISTDIFFSNKKEKLSQGLLVKVSKKGFIVQSSREFLHVLEENFYKFLNQPVEIFLSQYEVLFYGVIQQISSVSKDLFEIKIGFTKNTPLYYKECVEDLLS